MDGRSILALSLIALAVTGCSQSPADRLRSAKAADAAQAGLNRELAGLVPGQPTQCLPNYRRSDLRGYGGTLVYSVNRSLKYRNDTTGGCEGVGRNDDILFTRSNQGQVCAGDIAQTLDRGSRVYTGSCGLGRFVPYRRP